MTYTIPTWYTTSTGSNGGGGGSTVVNTPHIISNGSNISISIEYLTETLQFIDYLKKTDSNIADLYIAFKAQEVLKK